MGKTGYPSSSLSHTYANDSELEQTFAKLASYLVGLTCKLTVKYTKTSRQWDWNKYKYVTTEEDIFVDAINNSADNTVGFIVDTTEGEDALYTKQTENNGKTYTYERTTSKTYTYSNRRYSINNLKTRTTPATIIVSYEDKTISYKDGAQETIYYYPYSYETNPGKWNNQTINLYFWTEQNGTYTSYSLSGNGSKGYGSTADITLTWDWSHETESKHPDKLTYESEEELNAKAAELIRYLTETSFRAFYDSTSADMDFTAKGTPTEDITTKYFFNGKNDFAGYAARFNGADD